MINYGESKIDKIMFGEQMVDKVMYGESLLFSSGPKYWFAGTTANSNQTFTFKVNNSDTYTIASDDNCKFSYKPDFDTSNVTSMSSMFSATKKLTKVDGFISVKSLSQNVTASYLWGYSQNEITRKVTFKDIGYNTNMKQFYMNYASYWGVDSDDVTDARKSMIDSLITYSHNRASSGYSTCQIALHANTKALLTSNEIAQITAKGFTIA